ncbi:NACHT domain-containing protein [Actinopolyspora mortivallis]|uniref:NACHT domain-containing protein n=1 Tax=Actinopolyspora mortivallis TaxID=33906 RepID=UPI000A05204E|nr:NACHT domain-containing protein [Actinopolyspora mortivallis]
MDYYNRDASGRLVILGRPGVGKTVLAVRLAVDLLRNINVNKHEFHGTSGPRVPVLLQLGSWDPSETSLTEWMSREISKRFNLSSKITLQLVSEGWITPILDGLDEMDFSNEKRRAIKAVELINDYIAEKTDSSIVVICRSGPSYYDKLIRKVRNASEIIVQPLGRSQIVDYLELQCQDEDDFYDWKPVFNDLEESQNDYLVNALGTPWRLTAAVAFQRGGGGS